MINYTVQTAINKPVAEVFDAMIDNTKLTSYFVNKSSGPMKEGATIIWHWTNYGDKPVKVEQIIPNSKIVFSWGSDDSTKKLVTVDFDQLNDKKTMVKISESGWEKTDEAIQDSYTHVSGWENMTLCMKGFLEHGIDLRQ